MDDGDHATTQRFRLVLAGGSGFTTRTIDDVVILPQSITASSADTLTNKTLIDASTNIVDDGDNTKKLQFQCSGITPATTRTWTVPDSSDTIVGKATTDTLTNKTLTTPTVGDFTNATHTHADNANGGNTLTSPTINTSIAGTAFLDEDNMASDSATKVASQQSIKKYVDDQGVSFPSTTKMLFKQATAPTAWTIDDTITDKSAVRYTRGATFGADAGSVNLETAVSTTQGHSLSTAELATHNHSHAHTITGFSTGSGTGGNGTASSSVTAPTMSADATNAGSGTAHSHDIELRYTDVIVATKD